MKRILVIATFLVFAALGVDAQAHAQNLPSLRVATGGEKGTYYAMGTNMATYCSVGLRLDVQKTGGSDDNIERLTSSNKADVGIVQKDILFKRSKINKDAAVANLLGVMPLHYESMHVVVKAGSTMTKFSDLGSVLPVKGSFGGFVGGKAGQPGKRVGAYGGSIESAEIIKALSGVDFEIEVVENIDTALKALGESKIDAILAMGGTPLSWVNEKLARGQHRLVQFDVPLEKVAGAYKRANITYTKLGVNALPTIATDAVLVTRNFTSSEKVNAVSLLRKCILTELVRMQEADDTHGQWQNVSKENTQVEGWSYFAGAPVSWPPSGAAAAGQRRR